MYCNEMDKLHASRQVMFCFSGFAPDPKDMHTPYYSGIGISKRLGIPLIAIPDPIVTHDPDCYIGWHAGDRSTPDLPLRLAALIDDFCNRHQKQALLFGVSAGGFATMNILAKLNCNAIGLAMIPQTSIANYKFDFAAYYVKTAFTHKNQPNSRESISKLLNNAGISHDIRRADFKKKHLIFMQNVCENDLKAHTIPFMQNRSWKELAPGIFQEMGSNLLLMVGHWGEGHCPMPREGTDSLINHLKQKGENHSISDHFKRMPYALTPASASYNILYERLSNAHIDIAYTHHKLALA